MNRSADTCSADLFDGMFTEDSDSDRALYRHCILASDIMQTVGGHIYMKWMKYAAALAVVITLAGCAEKEEDMDTTTSATRKTSAIVTETDSQYETAYDLQA